MYDYPLGSPTTELVTAVVRFNRQIHTYTHEFCETMTVCRCPMSRSNHCQNGLPLANRVSGVEWPIKLRLCQQSTPFVPAKISECTRNEATGTWSGKPAACSGIRACASSTFMLYKLAQQPPFLSTFIFPRFPLQEMYKIQHIKSISICPSVHTFRQQKYSAVALVM
jgi:hypothetical protein